MPKANGVRQSDAGLAASKKTESRKNKGELNKTQLRILAEIRNNPNITKPQLGIALGVGKSTIDRNIASLRKDGRIERVGSNKFGCWKVCDVTNPNNAKGNLVDG
ncbi:MAG: winged helix-turn-helix transcriptional regulator [Thermoguttaceae bacterium]|nr:winged helix-turn-helix transcriptional regulator [Thermoguttaceae bacterium]